MMSSLLLTLSAKKLHPDVKYHKPVQQIQVTLKEKSDFLFPILKEEVARVGEKTWKKLAKLILKEPELTNSKLDRIFKVCKITAATSALLLALAHSPFLVPAMAATEVLIPGSTGSNVIMPKDIITIGLWIIGICAATSSVLAIILTQFAGGYRMLRKENKKAATEWTQEIMKGYTQIVLAPVIILAIAFIAYLFFGNFKWFAKPF